MADTAFDLLVARSPRGARLTVLAQLTGRDGLARKTAQRLYLDSVPSATVSAQTVVTGAPVAGVVAVQQVHAVAPVGVATGVPVVGVPAFGQGHSLGAVGVVSGGPVTGAPVLRQGHGLVAVGVVAGSPVAGLPGLAQGHNLGPVGALAGVPVIGLLDLIIVRIVAGVPVVLGAPVMGVVQLLPGGRAARRVAADVLGQAPEDARPLAVGGQRVEVVGSVRSPVPAPVMRRPAGMQVRRGYSGGRR